MALNTIKRNSRIVRNVAVVVDRIKTIPGAVVCFYMYPVSFFWFFE